MTPASNRGYPELTPAVGYYLAGFVDGAAEQAALADLAPIRPTPLPIEILAAGGPKLLREWLRKGKA